MSKSKPPHGNDLKSAREHHLYEIRYKIDNDVYKYGISQGEVDKNGYSKRM